VPAIPFINVLQLFEYTAKVFRDNIPVVQDEVTVEIVGQPGASKQELYYLAMAAAFGIVRPIGPLVQLDPFVPPSAASIMIEYDAADHWVRLTLMYRRGAVNSVSKVVGTDIFAVLIPELPVEWNPFGSVRPIAPPMGASTGDLLTTQAVYRGPQCDVVGGEFGLTSSILPGFPGTNDPRAPQLPWKGKTILTACPTVPAPINVTPPLQAPPPNAPLGASGPVIPSPNPKPSGDNRSRGSVVTPGAAGLTNATGCCPKTMLLVELVSAALTDPGTDALETWDAPAPGPTGR
jgi:hypothetical protein